MNLENSKFIFSLFLIIFLINGCEAETKKITKTRNITKAVVSQDLPNEFACENNPDVKSRGYVLLMGIADHLKEKWDVEKEYMEQDPKAKFVMIYDQDENSHIEEISEKFLKDIHKMLEENEVDEIVIFGSSSGGVIGAYSISKLEFNGPVALHTIAAPLKGYDLTGFREKFLGEREGFLKDISIGFGPYEPPSENVKVYHHKSVGDEELLNYCGELKSFCNSTMIQDNNIQGSKEFYYPGHDHLTIMRFVIRKVLLCYNPNLEVTEVHTQGEGEGLGQLCYNEEECNIICKNSMGQCKSYCSSHPENEICKKGFSFEKQTG